MYAYSKLRRENANFKINTKVDSEGNPIYVADPSTGSDEPITGLLQILPEGLDGYDFLGMCGEAELTVSSVTRKNFFIISNFTLLPAGTAMGPIITTAPVDLISMEGVGIYIPSNGYLVDDLFDFSSLAPEGEGGETSIGPANPLNPGILF